MAGIGSIAVSLTILFFGIRRIAYRPVYSTGQGQVDQDQPQPPVIESGQYYPYQQPNTIPPVSLANPNIQEPATTESMIAYPNLPNITLVTVNLSEGNLLGLVMKTAHYCQQTLTEHQTLASLRDKPSYHSFYHCLGHAISKTASARWVS